MTTSTTPIGPRHAAPGIFGLFLALIFIIFVGISALGFVVQNRFNEAFKQSHNLILVLDDLSNALRESIFWEIVHYASVTQGDKGFLDYSEEAMLEFLGGMMDTKQLESATATLRFETPLVALFRYYGASLDELDFDPDIAWYCAPEEPEGVAPLDEAPTEAIDESGEIAPQPEPTATRLPSGQIDNPTGERRLAAEFASRRSEQLILVEAMITARQNESEYECLHLTYRDNAARMEGILGEMAQQIEGRVVQASKDYDAALPTLLLISVLGLFLLTVVGILAFTSVAQVTRPVLLLTNVFNAIAGRQYRTEMLSGLVGRSDALSALASRTEQLIEQAAEEDARLQSETSALREQVKSNRRQRILSAGR
jgi:hypothetical protein